MFIHHDHSSTILKIQKIDTIAMFIDRRANKQNVAWPYNTVVLKKTQMQAMGL